MCSGANVLTNSTCLLNHQGSTGTPFTAQQPSRMIALLELYADLSIDDDGDADAAGAGGGAAAGAVPEVKANGVATSMQRLFSESLYSKLNATSQGMLQLFRDAAGLDGDALAEEESCAAIAKTEATFAALKPFVAGNSNTYPGLRKKQYQWRKDVDSKDGATRTGWWLIHKHGEGKAASVPAVGTCTCPPHRNRGRSRWHGVTSCYMSSICHTHHEDTTFAELGYRAETNARTQIKVYVLKDPAAEAAKGTLTEAEKAQKLAEDAAARANKRRKGGKLLNKSLLENLLLCLQTESVAKNVYRNGQYVTTEPLIEVKVTVKPTTPGEAEINIEALITDNIFKPENNLAHKGVSPALFRTCSVLKDLADLGDSGGGSASSTSGGGSAAAAGDVNGDFYKHILKWNEAERAGGVAIYKGDTNCIKEVLALAGSTGRHAAPQPAGLAVNAMPFQLQTISFMVDAEKNGCNAKLWTKYTTGSGASFYYSAPLNQFSKTLPEPVRGGILASEMGLGKTIMSLGLLSANPALAATKLKAPRAPAKVSSRGTLVVCAVSLVGQWVEEAKSKLTDSNTKIYAYHGSNRKRDVGFLSKQDIVVTTYSTLASDAGYWANKSGASYVAPLESIDWHRIILDESHTIKAGNTKQTKATLALQATNKWCMSGTPFCTSPDDILTQLRFIGMDDLASSFYRGGGLVDFAIPHCIIRHVQNQKIDGKNILELPPKEEIVKKIKLYGNERTVYRELHRTALAQYKAIPAVLVRTKTLQILSYLLVLRKACSGGVLKDGGAAPECLEECPICLDSCEEPTKTKCGHLFCKTCITSLIESNTGTEPCPICRTDLTIKSLFFAGASAPPPPPLVSGGGGAAAPKQDSAAATIAAAASAALSALIGGGGGSGKSPPPSLPQAAKTCSFDAKLKTLLLDLRKIRKTNNKAKVLIFSQFSETLERLKTGLSDRGYGYRTLTGGMSRSQRSKALSDFQKDPPTTVFLLSTRAGAVGINLTQANHVFLMEPSFNVALEKQAIGRVYRMGQKRKVHIVRYVIENSIEENMLVARKQRVEGEGMSGVGSIQREAKKDAGGMDFGVLFGTAADMPVAGGDDDKQPEDDDADETDGGGEDGSDDLDDDRLMDEGEDDLGGGSAASSSRSTGKGKGKATAPSTKKAGMKTKKKTKKKQKKKADDDWADASGDGAGVGASDTDGDGDDGTSADRRQSGRLRRTQKKASYVIPGTSDEEEEDENETKVGGTGNSTSGGASASAGAGAGMHVD